MAQTVTCAAGIDISKDILDVHIIPGNHTKQFTNTSAGWQALAKWLATFAPKRIVYEATGLYHKDMERALANRRLPIVRINSSRGRRFAQALGTIAKTDRLDARLLAQFGIMVGPEVTELCTVAVEKLIELQRARISLVKARTAQLARAKGLKSAILKRHSKAALRMLETQIEEIDHEALVIVKADNQLIERYGILISVPGIGPPTAIAMLALMPELGTLDEKQVASLAGLAPVARDSGTFRGKRFCQAGRRNLRRALYMPALVGARFNADLKAKYDSMIAAKKPAKVAITALMRKLLILANALLRDNRKWQPIAP